MNLSLNHTLMTPHMPTHAALDARGVYRRPARRVLCRRADEGSLNSQLPWRVITQRTKRTTDEGRAWREREGEEA